MYKQVATSAGWTERRISTSFRKCGILLAHAHVLSDDSGCFIKVAKRQPCILCMSSHTLSKWGRYSVHPVDVATCLYMLSASATSNLSYIHCYISSTSYIMGNHCPSSFNPTFRWHQGWLGGTNQELAFNSGILHVLQSVAINPNYM